jgi:tol-pal system protein YbgF
MRSNGMRLQKLSFLVFLVVAVFALALASFGCGSSEEATEDWETQQPPTSSLSMLEYRVDSLTNETNRLKDQLDAVAMENRKLTARNAELETRVTELTTAPPVTAEPVASDYDGALQKFHARDYQGAIASFEALLASGIEESLADNCQYWIGESHYALRQPSEAVKSFQKVFEFGRSSKKADAQLMIGNSYLMMGNKAAAKEAFEKTVADYPATSSAQKAKDKLTKL